MTVRAHKRQEGAVMFLVMMVIVMASATAAFAVHTASYELRGRGFVKQQMATGYLAEAMLMATMDWIDLFGPETVREQVSLGNGVTFASNFPEIALAPGKSAYRIYPEHFEVLMPPTTTPGLLAQWPFVKDATYGALNAYTPRPTADIYDMYEVRKPIPGMPDNSKYVFLRATITARGRGNLAADVRDSWDLRDYNESAKDVRAYVMIGPFVSGTQ